MKSKLLIAFFCCTSLIGCQREPDVVTETVTATVTDTGSTVTTMTTTDVAVADRSWGTYADWDADRDARLTRAEFDQRYGNVYTRWDADRDGTVAMDEMADTWYDLWDDNNDDFIDENEWTDATGDWNFTGFDYGTWADWDADNDGRLARNEFGGRVTPLWDPWDVNKNDRLEADEIDDSWWDLFDGNNDDIIEAPEWDRIWAG